MRTQLPEEIGQHTMPRGTWYTTPTGLVTHRNNKHSDPPTVPPEATAHGEWDTHTMSYVLGTNPPEHPIKHAHETAGAISDREKVTVGEISYTNLPPYQHDPVGPLRTSDHTTEAAELCLP